MRCLQESRLIYNEMLTSVKEQYEQKGTFPSKYDLTAQFKGRGGDAVPATTVQMLADRLSKSLKRFLACQELGYKVGFPRFKSSNRWHSIQLRQYGKDAYVHEDKKHLIVPRKIGGSLKIKLHRPFEGTPKTIHLVLRADGHWYALIVCETVPSTDHLPEACEHPTIGLDAGLKAFLVDSEGTTIERPTSYLTTQQQLRRWQRLLARRQPGSHRRRRASRRAAQIHLKIARQQRDFHFKVAQNYAASYQRLCVEDGVPRLESNRAARLAKSIYDGSWNMFLTILEDKAERAGHHVIRVRPRFTSHKCVRCGEILQRSLSVRTHICPHCGFVADRAVEAAKHIVRAGALPAGTALSGGRVELRSLRRES